MLFHLFFAYDIFKWLLLAGKKKSSTSLRRYQVENGYSPSYEEIARGLKLASIATVHKHISALDKKNYLQRSHNQSRSIDVAPRYLQEQRRNRLEASLEIPMLGTIAAGQPVETYEERDNGQLRRFRRSERYLRIARPRQFDD